MSSSLRNLFDRAWESSENRLQIRGRLGRKNDDGSFSMAVPARKNFFYVTLSQEGSQTVDTARVVGVPRLYNLPVVMRRKRGNLVVTGLDLETAVLDVYLNGGVSFAPPHTHSEGSGLEYEMQSKWFSPGRVLWSSGVTVRIRPFFFRYAGTRKYFPGGTLALTSYLPSTASKWAWVIVGVNPATNAASAFTGTEYSAQVDLLDSLIDDVSIGNHIPLAAIQCRNGDTSLSDIRRYRDARHWLDERFRLDDLTNVVITSPTDGQALEYDSGTSTWINATPAGADVAGAIHAATEKTTPVDADEFGIADSAASWVLKKLTWANIKATLKIYFDTLYAALVHATRHQHGGADEVATAVPAANAIPKAEASGDINAGWIPDLSGTYSPTGHTHSYQPLDTDLTEIAALDNVADQMLYSNATANWTLATLTAAGRALIDDADAAAQRVTLGLVIGTNVQAYDVELAAIAGLISAADKLPYFTGLGTAALADLTAFARTILDDATAGDARTTLGLGTISVEAATAFLRLAGVSGGQTAYGGTASGDDLTLNSTSHATKGYVLIQTAGGSVAIGKTVPIATLDLEGTFAIGDGTNQAYILKNWGVSGGQSSLSLQGQTAGQAVGLVLLAKDGDGTDNLQIQIMGVGGDASIANRERLIIGWDAASSFYQIQSEVQGTGTLRPLVLFTEGNTSQFYLDTNGRIGHGVATPAMFEFSHDGTSGRCFGTINVTDGTAQTIIADGALDVKDYVVFEIIVDPSTGTSGPISSSAALSSTITLFDSGGTEVLVLHVNANGSVDIQRTAGTRTYVCTVRLLWQ